ncbi:MAG: hypothetical protein L3K17_02600 [Thermoplasmata archaeon]|nr:hypothetical protein [Thermoplasmata archaeon]
MLPEPPLVDDLRLPSLRDLTEGQQRTLAYASAMGREFDFPLLVAAMGVEGEALAEELERLVRSGVLRERPGGDRFTFVHDELRAQIYQSLTASRLRVLHRKIAEAMERAYPIPPPESVAELGRHFFLGKVPEKSLVYNRQAAEYARQNDSPEEAAHFLERARIDLKATAGDHDRAETELASELGDLYYSMGDIRSADRLYAEALQKAGRDGPMRARLLLGRAEVARDSLQTDEALRGAREARELFSRSGDLTGLASVHRILGRIAYHRGAYREALDEGIRALDLLQPAGDPRVLGRLCIDIGNAFSMLGPEMVEEAVDWYARAVDRLSDAGDWAEVARAHVNRGTVLGTTNPTDGLEALDLGRQYAERAHEPRWVGWSLARGIELRLALGQVEEALQDNEQARRLLERADDVLGLHQVWLNEGLIQERRASWEEAEAAYRTAIERAQQAGLPSELAEGQFCLARLLYKTRDIARAREAYRAAAHLDLPALNPPLAAAFAELGRQIAEGERVASADSESSAAHGTDAT